MTETLLSLLLSQAQVQLPVHLLSMSADEANTDPPIQGTLTPNTTLALFPDPFPVFQWNGPGDEAIPHKVLFTEQTFMTGKSTKSKRAI